MRFTVSRAGKGGVVSELAMESRVGEDSGDVASILPAFRLRRLPRGGRRLKAAEKKGLKELSSALGLLLDALRTQDGRSGVLAQAESHEGKRGTDRLLRITLACNQRCRFCFVPVKNGRIDLELLERELDVLARQLGPRGTLTLSGGEPTVDSRLPEILKSARRKGIRRFVLQTNAVALARPGALEELIALGVKSYFVSFHSHRPETYDRLTGSRGLYPKAVAGLSRILSAKQCRVTCNVVINAWNYRDLPYLMGFLGGLSRARRRSPENPLEIFFSALNHIDKAPSLAVDLKEAAPHLERAVERCGREGLAAQRFTGESALPPCLLSRPAAYVSKNKFSQDRVRYAEDFSGDAGTVGRAKRPACRQCPYDARCLGVSAEYARIFGLGALRTPSQREGKRGRR